MNITYQYVTEDDLRLRRDPAWYVSDPAHHEHIATVTKDDREVRVFRDGEMRIHIWDSKESRDAGDAPEVVRYTDRLCRILETDEQLEKAFDEDRVEWHMNAWFDLYAYGAVSGVEPVWLDCVQHDLPTAIGEAQRALDIADLWLA
jgi:hypothetical protein